MDNCRLKTMQRLRLAVMLLFGLAGTGAASASPKILLDPNPLNFFELVVGSSGTVSYNVTNAGKTQLVVMDMQIAGPDADQFHFDGETDPFCGSGQDCASNFQLAPGASRSFFVVCAPSHPGFFTSTLTVKSNAANSTIALDCTGDAPASMSTLVVSPASIDFGVNFAEAGFPAVLDRTLTVTNTATAPSVPVEFQIVVPGTTGNGFFLLPLGSFGFVGPGESQDLVVEFRWFGGVVSRAPLVLQSTDASQPSISVPMFAEAAYGHLVFDDPPNLNGFIEMPAVAAGDTSTLTIRAHNDGDFGMGISDAFAFASFGGTAELLGPTRDASLAPGESIEWTLTCTPDGSEGFEDGASGTVDFHYSSAASDFDTFSLFCPTLSPPPTTKPSQVQLGDAPIRTPRTVDPATARIDLPGTDSAPEGGGCSASTPTSLAPLGVILLGLLARRRVARRRRTRVVAGIAAA